MVRGHYDAFFGFGLKLSSRLTLLLLKRKKEYQELQMKIMVNGLNRLGLRVKCVTSFFNQVFLLLIRTRK